jgi:uncharacterized membrane protein YgcG
VERTRTVGRYELVGELGAGGMAVVHLARQTGLDRLVALKELRAFGSQGSELALRFVREARVAGHLSHPNLVTVFDFFEEGGSPYIAMEYVRRGSLRPWMRGLTLAQIGGVLDGMLAGLAHAEQQRVVHRDLKPENLLVTDDGRVKITDFGIAKALDELSDATLTMTRGVIGTPAYMAPEQALGEAIGPWTDLYAVGVIAYELMSGSRPYPKSPAPMLIERAPPPVKTANPAVPDQLSDWVDRLLVRDPGLRTRSATVARDKLEDLMSELLDSAWRRRALIEPERDDDSVPTTATPTHTLPATPPPADLPEGPLFPGTIDVPTGGPTPVPGEPRRRRRRWPFAVAALAAVIAAGGVVAALTHHGARGSSHFRTEVAGVCRLAQGQQATGPQRTRALNRALERAKMWQASQRDVYFEAEQSLRDDDTLDAALLELNPPAAPQATVTSAVDTLAATSRDYRAYLLRLNAAGSSSQLAKTVAAFQPPDPVPVRVGLIDLGGPGCLSAPPPPVKGAPLFSPALMSGIQAAAHPNHTAGTGGGPATAGHTTPTPLASNNPTPPVSTNPTPPSVSTNPTPPSVSTNPTPPPVSTNPTPPESINPTAPPTANPTPTSGGSGASGGNSGGSAGSGASGGSSGGSGGGGGVASGGG